VAIGLVDPRNVKRNAGAKRNQLILGKPWAWHQQRRAQEGRLDGAGYKAMIAARPSSTRPERSGNPGRCAHRRHRLPVCWATQMRERRRARVSWSAIPLLRKREFARGN
jgi:hypothetical protein